MATATENVITTPRRPRHTHQAKDPHPIDVAVGSRVRNRRILMGISQERLADSLGLSFQQVQKYEKGANRISCGRIVQISEALDCSVMVFFEGLSSSTPKEQEDALLDRTETLHLVRAYYDLDRPLRARLTAFVRAIAHHKE